MWSSQPQLEAAAEQAAARGAPAAAAELYELAAELMPADPPLGTPATVRAADFYRLAGAGERAAVLLEHLLTEVPSGAERSDILFALALTRRGELSEFDRALQRCARRSG